jgi:Rrf2 family protein
MRISARCDYACKAIMELSLHWPDKEPLPIHTISKRQGIPMKYLVHILIELKNIGLVKSSRGKEGGYILAQPPGKITLGELIRHIGGPLLPVAETGTKKGSVFAEVWKEAEDAMAKVFDKVTFEDIVNKARTMDKAIVYQI